MANRRISIAPPTSGALSLNAGDTLIISTSSDCTFTCGAGDSFSPSLSSAQLSAGDNGPYTAQRPVANATYSASVTEAPRPGGIRALNAQSVQIKP